VELKGKKRCLGAAINTLGRCPEPSHGLKTLMHPKGLKMRCLSFPCCQALGEVQVRYIADAAPLAYGAASSDGLTKVAPPSQEPTARLSPSLSWSQWELFHQNGLLVTLASASLLTSQVQSPLKSVGAFPVTAAI